MNRIKMLFVWCWLLLPAVSLYAQDTGYSQFYANPLYLNPAFAGTSEHTRFAVNYRNQWPELGTTYSTYSISLDRFSNFLKGGLGIQVNRDLEAKGLLETSSVSLFYSHYIKISDSFFMNAALQAGAVYKGFDKSGLVFPSEINGLNGNIEYNESLLLENAHKIYPDFGVGLVGQVNQYYFGLNIQHLAQPDESLLEGDQKGKLPRKYVLHIGAQTRKLRNGLLSRPYTLSPNILYQQQGSFRQMNVGMYLNVGPLAGGVWYRQNLSVRPDAVIAMLALMYDRFKIGYSYDLTLSKVANYSNGSHELSLIFSLGKQIKSNQHHTLLIPNM